MVPQCSAYALQAAAAGPDRQAVHTTRVFSHPGWSPGALLLTAGGFCVPAGGTGRVRHRSRTSLDPGSRTGVDLRFLVAGPGFEPGETFASDFTDRSRYLPDLRECVRLMPFWHVFDMGAVRTRRLDSSHEHTDL